MTSHRGQPGAVSSKVSQPEGRVMGLRSFVTPTLEQVERQRIELWGLTLGIMILIALAVVVVSSGNADTPEWIREFAGTTNAIRISLVALVCGFAAYVVDKERRIRRLTATLVNERVLEAALTNRLKEISSLGEAGRAVLSSLELDEVLQIILHAAFDLLEADEGSVMLLEGSELVVAAAVGHPSLFVGQRHSVDEGLAGYVARTREPLLIEGEVDLVELGPLVGRAEPPASAMSVPLEARGELLGVLNLSVVRTQRRYSTYDLRALSLFAEQAAMAVRHARVLRREREIRASLAEADRLRAELVGSMAHDLKTPLTAILGAARTLNRRGADLEASRAQEMVAVIERQADRLVNRIDRLLEATRSQAPQLPLSAGPLDVRQQVEALARSYASAHGRRIAVEVPDERVVAYADAEAVEQVLANLLENAVKHTPPGTPVGVRVCASDGWVAITVHDEGPGIPEEEQAMLFEPFRQRRFGQGSGLGLFIASNLVRAMGGKLEVSSVPGRGAAFTFTLPARAPEPAAPAC